MEPSDVPDPSAKALYVGNLDRRVTDVMMINILRSGLPHISDKVLTADMYPPNDPLQGPDGYCFVTFEDNNAACQSMTFLNGRDFCGKKVKVNWATSSSNGGMPKVIGTSITIFVGDLDEEITDGELRQAFAPFGEILNAKVVRDAANNKSKNYGFVSFTNKPDAEKAIRDMSGAMLRRRPIKTNWATRNQKAQPSQLDYEQVYRETNEENSTVYVTNLPDRISESVLYDHFDKYGKIVGNPRLFDGKNFAFIKFESHSDATKAIVNGNGSELNGAILKCWWGKEGADTGHSSSNSGYSPNQNYHRNQSNQQQNQQNSTNQMTPEQYMQYMQQYQYQQYYQYWMQQYSMMQQQGNNTQGYPNQYQQQPQSYQQGYPQQQQQQQQNQQQQ